MALVPSRNIHGPDGKYPEAFKKEVVAFADKHGDKAASVKFARGEGQIWQWRRRLKGLPYKLTDAEKEAKANGTAPVPAAKAIASNGKTLKAARYSSTDVKEAAVAYAREHGTHGVRLAAAKFGVHVSTVWEWKRRADGGPARPSEGPGGRRQYDKAFRDKAVALSETLGSSKDAAAQLGISAEILGGWRHRAGASAPQARPHAETRALVPTVVERRTVQRVPQQLDLIRAGEQRLMVESLHEENEKLWELIAIMKRRRQ